MGSWRTQNSIAGGLSVAKLNEDGQWIVLMAFIISITMLVLALIVNQSTLVGTTTAEAVLEFPKSDIKDLRNEILRINEVYADSGGINPNFFNDQMRAIALDRKSALVQYSINIVNPSGMIEIHFNNGVTEYNEKYY